MMIACSEGMGGGRGGMMMAVRCSEGMGGTALVTCLSRQWRSRRAKAAWPPQALPTGGGGNQSLLLHPKCRHHDMRGEMERTVAAAASATAASHKDTHLIMQTLNHVLCGGLADDEHKP
jgi:hypothetical protein